MKALDLGKLDLPKWIWIPAAMSAILILSGLLWTGPTNRPAKIGTEPAWAVAQQEVSGTRSTPAVAPLRSATASSSDVTPAPRAKACVCPSGKGPTPAQPVTPRSMFPMGDVTRYIVAVPHPYRQPREAFPSFGFGHKIWSFVGRFVLFDEAELAPIGYNLDGRNVYAIANTAGPGSVLFVQSGLDPNRLAVYRHS